MPRNEEPIDGRLENADWIKMYWDLPWIQDADTLRGFLRDRGISIDNFKKLPIYRNNIKRLRWLRDL
jgi:hypothetical protein